MVMSGSIDRIFEGKGVKSRVKQALFILACLAIVTLAGTGMNSCANAQAAERAQIAQLIPGNYPVDAVGPAKQYGFSGYTFSIATGKEIHLCGGVTMDEVLAKKPIHCSDGWTISAKK